MSEYYSLNDIKVMALDYLAERTDSEGKITVYPNGICGFIRFIEKSEEDKKNDTVRDDTAGASSL